MRSARRPLRLVPFQYTKSGLLSQPKWQPARTLPHRSQASTYVSAIESYPTISILTYNVWFDNLAVAYRYPALLDLVCGIGADVVCLQEVTNTFISYLLEHEGVRKTYMVVGMDEAPSAVEGVNKGKDGRKIKYRLADGMRYGCLILVNQRTLSIMPVFSEPESTRTTAVSELTPFPTSRQDRRLLSIRVRGLCNTHTEGLDDLIIGTAHFESPLSARDSPDSPQLLEREAQLRFAKSILPPLSIVCGDTNIHLPIEDEMPQRLGYVDAWLQVHPQLNQPADAETTEMGEISASTGEGNSGGNAGYTFPTSYNLPRFDQSIEPRRLDRVLLGSHRLRAVAAEILGMKERITVKDAGGLQVPYSDHGAVLVRVEIARG